MPQQKSAAGDAADRIGEYTLDECMRRDRLGEVYSARGPRGSVRIRLATVSGARDRVARALQRLATVRSPAVAPLLDMLADTRGRVAVVTPADSLTLARRRRAGRLPPRAAAALGPALLDGLAALHAAGLAHGAVDPALVGIDEAGRARWQDATLAIALGSAAIDPQRQRVIDVRACAAMLRDLARLPAPIAELVDPVASGSSGALEDAASLASAWRAAAATHGVAVPPLGSAASIPDLLAARRRRGRTLALPRRARRPIALALMAVAVALPVTAWALPGGKAALHPVADYLPQRQGAKLTYHAAGAVTATVTIRVAEARTVAGVFTVSVVNDDAGNKVQLLGLGGATLRLQDGALVRTAAGGALRDLVPPLTPGQDWSDNRSQATGTTTETRTLLGPANLVEPGGRFEHCAVVALQSSTSTSGGPGASGSGTLWYCPGVGLARAVLVEADQTVTVDLVSVA